MNIFELTHQHLLRMGRATTAMPETQSTNDIAKAEAFSTSDAVRIYLTDRQTGGRGRGTNRWNNPPPGQSLMMTYSSETVGAPQAVTGPLVGLAVYRALATTWPQAKFAIKAPNDIYLKGKKVGGLLVEAVQLGSAHRLIIGLGLNVLGKPNEIADAGALIEYLSVEESQWQKFIQHLLNHLQWSVEQSQSPHLEATEREDLLKALNQNENLKTPFISVSPFGDLATSQNTFSWRSL